MNIILSLIFTACGGFLAHLTRPVLIREFTNDGKRWDGWFSILAPSVGVVVNLPFALDLFGKTEGVHADGRSRFVMAYLLSFLAFGIGVLFGHWLLPDDPGGG